MSILIILDNAMNHLVGRIVILHMIIVPALFTLYYCCFSKGPGIVILIRLYNQVKLKNT